MKNCDLLGLSAWVTLFCFLAAGRASSAVEYEVEGRLTQTTVDKNRGDLHSSASFTVFVRDCSWFIDMIETNENKGVSHRQFGATNENEFYECSASLEYGSTNFNGHPTNAAGLASMMSHKLMMAQITPGQVPVGQLDNAIIGHLWLMFASQCYWPWSTTNSPLTPVYDWQGSFMAGGQNRKVPAKWELLTGVRSLPKDVQYFGGWGQTNGWYHTTGTKMAGDVVVPSGFFFEERQIGQVDPNTLTHTMALRKRVDVTVTDVRAGCSRTNLLPLPGALTMVMDLRVPGEDPPGTRISFPPSYSNPTPGQWSTLEEATKLAEVRRKSAAEMRQRAQDRGRAPAPPPDIR